MNTSAVAADGRVYFFSEDGKDIDYTGASGPIDMDVHGNPTSGVFDLYQYAAGGLEVVGEVPVSKPNPAAP